MLVRCVYCEDPVETEGLGVSRMVTGWEARRRAGGTNALKLRQPSDTYAHTPCVDLASKGLRGQQSLAI